MIEIHTLEFHPIYGGPIKSDTIWAVSGPGIWKGNHFSYIYGGLIKPGPVWAVSRPCMWKGSLSVFS